MSSDLTAFWIDRDYDREHASGGASRYENYVRGNCTAGSPMAECWDGTIDDPRERRLRFAVAAWDVGTPPVMSPGYVRRHPRVLAAHPEYSGWDGSLTAVAELVAPWPAALATCAGWQRGAWWRDWPQESLGATSWYREPGEEEAAGHRYLMAGVRMLFPLAPGLPDAPSGPSDDVGHWASTAVRALVTAMNDQVAPVIEALEERR